MEFVFEWVGVGVVGPPLPHLQVESGQKGSLISTLTKWWTGVGALKRGEKKQYTQAPFCSGKEANETYENQTLLLSGNSIWRPLQVKYFYACFRS